MSTSSASSATSAAQRDERQRTRLHPRAGPLRLDHDRGRVDDRLGHLYCVRGYRAADGLGGRAARRLGDHRGADDLRGALLRRTGCDDAQGRRAIRLPARILLAAVGLSVRLDAFSGDPDGHDRRGGGGLRAISRRALSGGFAGGVDRRADAHFGQICGEPLLAAILRHSADRLPDRREYARPELGQVHPEYFHLGQDAGADWAGYRGHLPGAQCGRDSG